MVGTSASARVLARVLGRSLGFSEIPFAFSVPRDTAVKASKKLSARCSSVVWNTRRLLMNDWHAVCEAGLLNSQSCTTQQQGQPGQQRPRHVHKRAGRDGHLVARCCRVPSCFCPMCHFGRSIVRVVEGFLCATPRRMHAPAGVMRFPSHPN
jgi:hypothetical protein